MEVTTQSKLYFNGVDIISVNFGTKAPRSKEMTVSVECEPTAIVPKNSKDRFNVVMDVKVSNEKYFELSLRAIGSFKLSEDITEDIRKQFMTANAPAIMFPYVRAFVATFTANLGNVTGTLILPPQFFKGNLDIVEEENEDKNKK